MADEQFTNKLIDETSPYLLQHAHNPVQWYPWGNEALEHSRREDKPILLSIGYSACHWCHVMEHESFENEQIARLMNENFVCIKVDREERPDLDSVYMNAVQMMTGHGGWPLTVFLTPELKPFYGGTYYPPADRRGMAGFPRVLAAIAESYRDRKSEVAESSESITAELRKSSRFHASSEMLSTDVLDAAFHLEVENFDRLNGGFGGAPKFPPSMSLMFLLRQHKRTNRPAAIEMVELTLDRMAAGGMYDQVGGGFHRYSVDAHWLVPHFEKMLYDNALLARIYLYAFQATKKPRYRQVVEEILEYVLRDMTSPEGGFYSSEDADSEGVEGKFYTWTYAEVLDLLGQRDGEVFAKYFDVTEQGNFEQVESILNTPKTLDQFALESGLGAGEILGIVNRGKRLLFHSREERIRPARDDKILTGWNGLMLTAFAEAAGVFGRDDYREVARRNADFILDHLTDGNRLLRTYNKGRAKLSGYLEDYAFLVEGLLALYETTGELKYFDRARSLADTMMEQFWDESDAGFFFTSADHEELIARTKEYFDNAIPSGNSVAAMALLKLSLFTGETGYQRSALGILRMMQTAVKRYPNGFGYLLCALDFYLSEPKEIAIIGSADSHEVRLFFEEIYSRFLPNKVVALSETGDEAAAERVPLLRGRYTVDGKPTVYVCRNYTCLAPVTTPEQLAVAIDS
jgi:uncharacterized protein YyaL (SSP411 family)